MTTIIKHDNEIVETIIKNFNGESENKDFNLIRSSSK